MTIDRGAILRGVDLGNAPRIAQALLAQRSLAQFVRQAWHVEHGAGSPLLWGWHLDAICLHLEAVARGEIQSLAINVPPGMAKSLLVSVYLPAWIWLRPPEVAETLLGRGADAQFLCVSGADDVAIRDARRMRELVESSWYQDTATILGLQIGLDPRQESKGYYVLDGHAGHRISRSTGRKITGLRGDAVIIDDPIDAADAHNAEKIDAANQWYSGVLDSRRNNARWSPTVLIMQRLHAADMSAHLLALGFEHLCLPEQFEADRACTTSIGWRDPRSDDGDLLLPEFRDAETIQRIRTGLGEIGYAAQYQQRPVPAGGAIFRSDTFRYWHELPELSAVVVSGDCTFRETRHADYTVGQIWGIAGPDRYLLDQRRERVDLVGAKALFRSLVAKASAVYGRCDAVLIEETANGPAVIEDLRRFVPGVIPINVGTRSKEERAHVAAVPFDSGNVYFPDPSTHAFVRRELEPELVGFPAATHDDCVDALTQALIWISQQFRRIVVASLGGTHRR